MNRNALTIPLFERFLNRSARIDPAPRVRQRAPFGVVLILSFLFPVAAPADLPAELLVGPVSRFGPYPWAGDAAATAVYSSPGELGLAVSPEILFGRFSTDGLFDEDDVLFIRSRRFGFGVESMSIEPDRKMKRYVASLASPVGNTSALGVSYSLFTSDDPDLDDLTSLDISLAFRPAGKLLAVFAARNINETELGDRKVERYYEGGLRSNHFRKRLGLFVQARIEAGDKLRDGDYVGGVEYRALSWLLLRARVDDREEPAGGAEILFDSFAIGFQYFQDSRVGDDGGFTYFRLMSSRRATRRR